MKKLLVILFLLVTVVGCTSNETDVEEIEMLSYQQISQEEAKRMMDELEGYIILDAREKDEYDEGHIPNAIQLSYLEIEEKAESILTDKDQVILVYCRSGRRSKIASESLVKLGYTNVYEFGGIIDWPYEIVK